MQHKIPTIAGDFYGFVRPSRRASLSEFILSADCAIMPNTKIESVQLLRAVAALLVVFSHAQGHAATAATLMGLSFSRLVFWPGGAGVDLFFVISGFVMVYSSEKLFGRPNAAPRFLLRRAERIIPLYWACATLYLGVMLWAAKHGGAALPDLNGIICSYLFIPFDTYNIKNGFAFPFLDLGWTLNYEMFFYLIFALFIVWPREKAIIATVSVLTVIISAGLIVHPENTQLRFWSQPIMLNFCAGMGIALLRRKGFSLPGNARLAILVIAVVVLVTDPLHLHLNKGSTPNDLVRVAAWGAPTIMIMAATVLGADVLPAWAGKVSVPMGNASYSLYLTHPFVLIFAGKLLFRSVLVHVVGLWTLVGLTTLIAIAVSLVVYRLFELPVTILLQARTRGFTSPVTRTNS